MADQPERQERRIGVTTDLTEAELDRLCDFIELLDRWDREDRAKEMPASVTDNAQAKARHYPRKVSR